MQTETGDVHEGRFITALCNIGLTRRITDAMAMAVRGMPNDEAGRRNKDALLHMICSLYDPLDAAETALEGLTATYVPEQMQGRVS